MEKLALTLPGDTPVPVKVPPGVPTGIQLGPLITLIIELLMIIGVILSLLYLIYGGIYWTQSKGDKETLDRARRIILYSILGLIVMSLSLIAVNVVTSAIGVPNLLTQ